LVRPDKEGGQQGSRFGPLQQPLAWRREARLGLDGIESGDALDRLPGNRRLLAVPDIEELAPAVRPARDLGDRPVGAKAAIGGALIMGRAADWNGLLS